MSFNVASHLDRHAEARPGDPALSFPAASYRADAPKWDTLSYGGFQSLSVEYAAGFLNAGVKKGDRVLMLMKPRAELWAVLFALFRIGAVPVIIDPNMGRKRLLECISQIGCRVVIAESIVHALRTTFFRSAFTKCEIPITVGRRWWWGGTTLDACRTPNTQVGVEAMGADELAAIAFTSGSTGTPKGVAYHHGMWDAEVKAIGEMFNVQPGDVSVQCFAAFAILDLCWGHHAVIPKMDLAKPATAEPNAISTAIIANKGQMVFGSPIVWMNLQEHCAKTGLTLPTVDRAITTGAPTPIWLLEAYTGILNDGVEFHTPYGATEAIPVSHISSGEILKDTAARTAQGAGTCVGKAAKGMEIQILGVTDDDLPSWSDDRVLPQGEIGEIVVRAAQVSKQYMERPKANRGSKIHCEDGTFFHRMGDLGYIDDQGRLWFCGRTKHRLQTADGMVAPVPVEGIYNAHDAVFRTALVGVGPKGRQVPVLCVELNPGHSWSSELEASLQALAAGTRWEGLVQRFLVHTAFPTDARHNSKIRRGDLKQWADGQCPDLSAGMEAA